MSNTDFPVVITPAGVQPTPPATIRASIDQQVTATNPGYTSTLPGSLVEDVLSTEVAGVAQCDSARVEVLNSLTTLGSNDFLTAQQGQIFIGPGSAPGVPTNTSVSVVFSAVDENTSDPLPGQVIPIGFTVSDGIYQYVVQDGGVTASDGQTLPLYCIAVAPGSWAVPTNTVSQLITQAPPGVALTCFNPEPGVAGLAAAETSAQYRARVLQAQQAVGLGLTTLLKTLLGEVPGVQQRLVSVRQQPTGWEIIVGGGDPYLVAGEIMDAGINIAGLVGSTLAITNITNANPGVITTALNHGYTTGQAFEASGIVGMTPLNGVPLTATVIDEKHFSIGVDTTSYPAYVSGGVIEPNLRNVTASISDQPDIYTVIFVAPPAQTVTMVVTWDTTSPNFTSQAAVAALASPALAAYVNAIEVGGPISLVVLGTTFAAAVSSVLDVSTISELEFAVSINGVSTSPTGSLVIGDPESYFQTAASSIVVQEA